MKNTLQKILFATLTAATLSTACAREAIAQTYYWSQDYAPSEYYGIETSALAVVRTADPRSHLNGRQAPSTNARIISSFYTGDTVYVGRRFRSADGSNWYLVGRLSDYSLGWVHGDYLRF